MALWGEYLIFSAVSMQTIIMSSDPKRVLRKSSKKGWPAEIKETCYLVGVIDRWLWNPDELEKLRDAIDKIRKGEVFKEESIEADRLDGLESRIKALQDFVKQETENIRH